MHQPGYQNTELCASLKPRFIVHPFLYRSSASSIVVILIISRELPTSLLLHEGFRVYVALPIPVLRIWDVLHLVTPATLRISGLQFQFGFHEGTFSSSLASRINLSFSQLVSEFLHGSENSYEPLALSTTSSSSTRL